MQFDWEWFGRMVGQFSLGYGLVTVLLAFGLGLAAGSVGLVLLSLVVVGLVVLTFVVHSIGNDAKPESVTSGSRSGSSGRRDDSSLFPAAIWESGPENATRRQKLLFYALGLLALSVGTLILWGEVGPGT